MIDAVNKVLEEKRENRKLCFEMGMIPPRYDLRDYTDGNLIYGMKKFWISTKNNPSSYAVGDEYNLGECLTLDSHIPSYRFFHFKDLCEVFSEVVKECGLEGMKVDTDEFAFNVTYEIVSCLAGNDKYYRKFYGKNVGYRICIFLYNGPYTDQLTDLAEKFRQRDLKEAMATGNYFNSRLSTAIDNVWNGDTGDTSK